MLETMPVLPVDVPADAEYGGIRSELEAAGQTIGLNDLLIGAHAYALGLLVLSGVAGFLTWGTWWCVLSFAVYGVLYAAADHRAHELSHGTLFKTRWINEVLYQLAAFMILHEVYYWRWSHSRHNTHTIIVGRDPEIVVQRLPGIPALMRMCMTIASTRAPC